MQLLNANLFRLAHELEIRTRKRMDGRNLGQSFLHGKGRGMEFRDVRPYLSGDDIRMIDWNVSSRTGEIHVKEFFLERDLPVLIFLDISYSMLSLDSKKQTGFQLAIFLAYIHFISHNKAQIICYSDKIIANIPPIQSVSQLWKAAKKLQENISFAQETKRGTNHNLPYQYLQEKTQLRSLVYWISDFSLMERKDRKSIHKKHELHACALDSGLEDFHNSKLKSFFFPEPSEISKLGTQYLSRQEQDLDNLKYNFHQNCNFFHVNKDLSKQIMLSLGNSL
ncbi:MAG: DUF58 domain-containing protein [Leptospiraceae bacterium]|nr:DUF58 domain-containing protein [Leptospiraceae bacterium]